MMILWRRARAKVRDRTVHGQFNLHEIAGYSMGSLAIN